MSLLLARFPFKRRAGLRLFVCVAIFGVGTIVFGLSHNWWRAWRRWRLPERRRR